jgi:hypothetical protein
METQSCEILKNGDSFNAILIPLPEVRDVRSEQAIGATLVRGGVESAQ